MAKWADCVITRVRFNAARTHIDELEVHDDLDTSLGPARTESRFTVIANLRYKTYITAPPSGESVRKGALVYTITISGNVYLKTYADGTTRDNLDNLPEF
ncbi:MAG TPA: DUF3892 domain-containing protein [Polyangiaceae bacterium]|nr:DUF3892 domain-containing protein [Polyangiaceae bacterium]